MGGMRSAVSVELWFSHDDFQLERLTKGRQGLEGRSVKGIHKTAILEQKDVTVIRKYRKDYSHPQPTGTFTIIHCSTGHIKLWNICCNTGAREMSYA
jgi:hypothetical protein